MYKGKNDVKTDVLLVLRARVCAFRILASLWILVINNGWMDIMDELSSIALWDIVSTKFIS